MTTQFNNTRIEFHILQSFPVTCLNRDDVGAPKTAIVGGVPRARVSSQCWKRQVRLAMQEFGVTLANRTKYLKEMLITACLDHGANEEQAQSSASAMADALIDDSLIFISTNEVAALGAYAKSKEFDLKDRTPKNLSKDISKVANNNIDPNIDALDIALFGRMVAKAPTMNVEAAASFSHAISTHKVSNEIEFFTALDDIQGPELEQGAGHIGSLEYNSATYYRYISLDLGQLEEMLGTADLKTAVAAFTKALFVAVPAARQSTQSGASPWDFARVLVRNGQRLQAHFETPVKSKGDGFLEPSISALKEYLDKKQALLGSLYGSLASYDWGEDKEFTIDDLVTSLQSHISGASG